MQPDWWARGIAIASLTLAGRHEWQGRPRVEAILTTNRAIGVGQTAESEVVRVTVRTHGRATTVENIGLAPDKEVLGIGWLMTPLMAPSMNPETPKFLGDGESATWSYHLSAFRSQGAEDVALPVEAMARAIVTLSKGVRKSDPVHVNLLTPPPRGDTLTPRPV